MSSHIAAGFKAPHNMTRKEKLDFIRYLKINEGIESAQLFWLRECPRISKKSYLDAVTL